MFDILINPNQEVLIGLLCLAAMRVYFEIIGYDLLKLPVSKKLAVVKGQNSLRRFHRMGLFFSVGYILLFAPQLILQ